MREQPRHYKVRRHSSKAVASSGHNELTHPLIEAVILFLQTQVAAHVPTSTLPPCEVVRAEVQAPC